MSVIRLLSRLHSILLFVCLFLGVLGSGEAYGAVCDEGRSVPPYVGTDAVDPNVLLMIDNSASMYDLAAVGSSGVCYDGPNADGSGGYVGSKDYSGYFRPYIDKTHPGYIDPDTPPLGRAYLEDAWYKYVEGRFIKTTKDDAKNHCTAAVGSIDSVTYYDGVLLENLSNVCLLVENDSDLDAQNITKFAARGNFLNWLAASKFDIQKKVLTGGKYDETNSELLIMESRGCLNHRYVKKHTVQNSSGNEKGLTLGIRTPSSWEPEKEYPAHSVVKYNETGYYALVTIPAGTVPGNDPTKWQARDYSDLTQIEIFRVKENGFNNTYCELALEEMAGLVNVAEHEKDARLGVLKGHIEDCLDELDQATTLEADSNSAFNQSTQDCWYRQKHPANWTEMLADDTLSTENMDNIKSDCLKVYRDLEREEMTPADIQPTDPGYVCYGYNFAAGTGGFVGRCWDQGDCQDVSCDGQPSTGAREICRDNDVYYCPGTYSGNPKICEIGTGNSKVVLPEDKWPKRGICEGNWDLGYSSDPPGGSNELNGCIQQALEDYCGYFSTPEVVDPSDQVGSVSGEFYNAPAILIEMAVEAQLKKPLLTMNGLISRSQANRERGVLEENASAFRFGAMAFNEIGKGSGECAKLQSDPNLQADCDGLEGARVISYLAGKENIGDLTNAINIRKATTWTPLAEAMYNAIAYYRQDSDMRLNFGDFVTQAERDRAFAADEWSGNAGYNRNDMVTYGGSTYIAASDVAPLDCDEGLEVCPTNPDPETATENWHKVETAGLPAEVDPVEYHCQSNNILFITEGASTFDINSTVAEFVETPGHNDDVDVDFPAAESTACNPDEVEFCGSTYLDDLTWFGRNGDVWGGTDKEGKEYQKIRTWIVESSQRGNENSNLETEPLNLLCEAAKNGSLVGDDYTCKFGGACPNDPNCSAECTDADPDYPNCDTTDDNNEVLFRIRLQTAFDIMRDQVSSGSAASVISASRSGEGALYQAIFWPEKDTGKVDPDTEKPITVSWTGEVHALLVDSQGTLYMDDCKAEGCQTGGLDEPYDSDGDYIPDKLLDTPIVVYGDEIGQTDTSGSAARTTKGCPGSLVQGEIVFFSENGACINEPKALEDIQYLWSTSEWLNSAAVDEVIQFNRVVDDGDGITEDVVTLVQVDGLGDPILNESGEPIEDENGEPIVTEEGNVDVDASLAFDFSDLNKRFIFTWNDLNNDGVVDYHTEPEKHEMRDFEPHLPPMGSITGTALPEVATNRNRGPVPLDFGVDPRAADAETKVTNIINWVRGKTVAGMRDRQVPSDKNENGTAVWKLGDVIHSTPVSVSAPAENYHLLYRDQSYRDFAARWQNRRHMIYFGANDGMLHAVNGGFFNQIEGRFCRDQDCESTSNTLLPLGAEMWAYVPYNLLPHLSCLTDPGYGLDEHKYFVDLRPRIFDVQIFKPEEPECGTSDAPTPLEPGCIHPNGWGTILVGGMRFGGSKMRPGQWNDELDYDNREFTSAYFIFDITDPERVPTLLGEFTRTVEDTDSDGVGDTSAEVELGYTTVIPTMVPMKVSAESADLNGDGTIVDSEKEDKNCDTDTDDPAISKWYLALGSGPTEPELDGTSSRNGSVSIIPLDRLVSKNSETDPKKDMRIPAAAPVATGSTEYGTIALPDGNSFISDMITVDMELNKDYLADVMYFGTISGDWYDNGGWGGKMYRLVTREECSGTGKQRFAAPDEWGLSLLLDAGKPITSSPTVGTDGTDFWVYFGTGRFFHDLDKEDSSSNALQTFYGIREPIADDYFTPDCGSLTWAEVSNLNASSSIPYEITTSGVFPAARGTLGLLPVGDIGVLSSPPGYQDLPNTLICKGDTSSDYSNISCLPSTVLPTATVPYPGTRSFRDLVYTITGTSRNCGTGTMGTDGWYRDFPDDRERNLGQATLFGALLNYTTYQPYNDICVAEGLSYLYSVYYQTGTAWVEDIFGNVGYDPEARQVNPDRVDLGKGLTTTPSLHKGPQGQKVFVQTSTGRIVEIPQPNLPEKQVKSGRIKWRDIEQ